MPCRKAVQWLGKIDKARDGPCFWPSQALSGRLSGLHYTVVGEPLVLQCPFPFLLLSSRAAGFNFSRDPWTYLLESPESHLVTHMRSSLYGSEFPDKQLFIVSCHGVFLVAPWCNMNLTVRLLSISDFKVFACFLSKTHSSLIFAEFQFEISSLMNLIFGLFSNWNTAGYAGSKCPNVSTTPITAMGFLAMFTFQLDNTKR